MSSILIIDDDVALMTRLGIQLEQAGYQVKTSSTLAHGEELVILFQPDLVILELQVEQGKGWDLLARLVDTKPVMVLSRLSLEDEVVRALDIGASDYIAKPYRSAELLARIRMRLQISTRISSIDPLALNPVEPVAPLDLSPVASSEPVAPLDLSPVASSEPVAPLDLSPMASSEPVAPLDLSPVASSEPVAPLDLSPVASSEPVAPLDLSPVASSEPVAPLDLSPVASSEPVAPLDLSPVASSEPVAPLDLDQLTSPETTEPGAVQLDRNSSARFQPTARKLEPISRRKQGRRPQSDDGQETIFMDEAEEQALLRMPPPAVTQPSSPGPDLGSGGVGTQLRAERLRRHLTLVHVENELKIRMYYLQAMEDGKFSLLPRGPTTIPLIKRYAEYLGLDANMIIDAIRAQGFSEKVTPLPALGGQPVPRSLPRWLIPLIAILLALTVSVGLIALFDATFFTIRLPEFVMALWNQLRQLIPGMGT